MAVFEGRRRGRCVGLAGAVVLDHRTFLGSACPRLCFFCGLCMFLCMCGCALACQSHRSLLSDLPLTVSPAVLRPCGCAAACGCALDCQVLDVDFAAGRATIKLVPRLDLAAMAKDHRSGEPPGSSTAHQLTHALVCRSAMQAMLSRLRTVPSLQCTPKS